jgi:hypothetical protein
MPGKYFNGVRYQTVPAFGNTATCISAKRGSAACANHRRRTTTVDIPANQSLVDMLRAGVAARRQTSIGPDSVFLSICIEI